LSAVASSGADDRAYWVAVADRVARPVLSAMAEGRLRATMPVGGKDAERNASRTTYEALGRTLAGIAPWLGVDGGGEGEQRTRNELAELARDAIAHAVDPGSPDYLDSGCVVAHIVDAAFLAHGLLRGPAALWDPLSDEVKGRVADALEATRWGHKPWFNNWLLFSALIEAALHRLAGRPFDRMRVDYALRQHEQWYLGDGLYGDGPTHHWDYYNSFVIHPMLQDTAEALAEHEHAWAQIADRQRARGTRYAGVLERLISPEGTLPPIGRSLVYRFGALQQLGQAALRHELPDGMSSARVRCGMTAVIRRLIEADGTFDDAGFLRIGFCGDQPDLGEGYISTGSLYLCCCGLLPLGLPADDPFWADPAEPWTARRVYGGDDLPADHAIGG